MKKIPLLSLLKLNVFYPIRSVSQPRLVLTTQPYNNDNNTIVVLTMMTMLKMMYPNISRLM